MKKKSLKLKVSPELGSVSAECFAPDKPLAILLLAHGAGAGMDHSFMVSLATLLADRGIASMRFNFPFAEFKKGRPDAKNAHPTLEAALAKVQELYPGLPLFMAGKSFGGRMSSQLMAAQPNTSVKGLIFYGFPLHPAGKPSTDRADHLKAIKIPMLFLQGTKDTLATWELIEAVTAALKPATLIRIDGADHGFKAGKRNVVEELANETLSWVEEKLKNRNT